MQAKRGPDGADQCCLFDRPLQIGKGAGGEGRSPGESIAPTDNENDRERDAAASEDGDQLETIDDQAIEPENQAAAAWWLASGEEVGGGAEIPYLRAVGFEQDLERIADDFILVDQEYLLVVRLMHVMSPRRMIAASVKYRSFLGAPSIRNFPYWAA